MVRPDYGYARTNHEKNHIMMNHDPHVNPYTIAKLRNLLKIELHKRASRRFNKKDAVRDIEELLIGYLKKQIIVAEGEISDYMLTAVKQAAADIMRAAQFEVLSESMLKLPAKKEPKQC